MSQVLVEPKHSLSNGYTRAMDLSKGGQQGFVSDPAQWVSNSNYVRQRMIAVLIEAPGFMKYMDDGPSRINMLKSLIETMATNISGLTSKLDVSFAETKVSNAGELHHTMTQVVRGVSVPAFTWPGKEGQAIFNFFNQWVIDLLADPETGHPGLVNKSAYQSAGHPEFLPDAVSMTCLFFEPSKDLSRITNAWLVTNMMPKSSGENEGKRAIGEGNETVEQAIEFTGTTQVGVRVTQMAQSYLDGLAKDGFRPTALASSYTSISSDVAASVESFNNKVQDVADAIDTISDLL